MTGNHPPHGLLRPAIVLPFLLVTLIWGSTWLVIKDQLGAAPPSWSVTWRFGIAAAGMFAFAAWRGEKLWLDRQGQLFALGIGIPQFFMNFNFVYRAELHLTSGLVAVLYGLLMVPNALLARVFLGQPVTRGFLIGSLIGLGGIALLLLHESRFAQKDDLVALGIGLTFCGIFCASIANVLQAAEGARSHNITVLLAWAMLWGTLADAVFAFVTVGPPVFPVQPRYWAAVSYLAIVGSVITFPLYFQLIRNLGAGRAAYNGVMVPVVAMALSTLFEGYRWSALAVAGAVLALAGMVVALRARKPVR